MKCLSRSTLGVIIGILNISIYIFVSVLFIIRLQALDEIKYITEEQVKNAGK